MDRIDALLCKGETQGIEALKIVQEILPFSMLGMDTDNVLTWESW
jgi:hypothetical protein